MTKARDLADIVSNLSANAGKAVVVNSGGTELEFGVAGGEISTLTDAYKNFNNINANTTTTLVSTKNYFLAGDITVADTYTWTVGGTGTLTII